MTCKHERDIPAETTRVVINVNNRKVSICTWSSHRAWDYSQFKQLNKPRKLSKFFEGIGYTLVVKERKYTVLEKINGSRKYKYRWFG